MEQKRTLWIMAAVGVFLLVVLGAALILYSPTARSSQTIANVIPSNNKTSSGWVSLAPSEIDTPIPQTKMPATETVTEANEANNVIPEEITVKSDEKITRVAELTVYADKTTIINNSPEGTNNVASIQQTPNFEQVPVPQALPAQTIINNTTTIDLTPAVKETPVVTPKNELTKNKIKNKAVASKPVIKQETKQVKEKATAPVKTKTTQKKVVTKTEKPKTVQYWVQVTSLTSKKGAENAREVLDENKITADIFTYKDKKDQLFYRVRVGPYTTKSEAEYWKSKIAKIDNFSSSSSYITSTTLD